MEAVKINDNSLEQVIYVPASEKPWVMNYSGRRVLLSNPDHPARIVVLDPGVDRVRLEIKQGGAGDE